MSVTPLQTAEVSFKIELKHESASSTFHRFRGAYSFSELSTVVSHLWGGDHPKQKGGDGVGGLVLHYIDDEDDEIRISSEVEWDECVRIFLRSTMVGTNVLRLTGRRKSSVSDKNSKRMSKKNKAGQSSSDSDSEEEAVVVEEKKPVVLTSALKKEVPTAAAPSAHTTASSTSTAPVAGTTPLPPAVVDEATTKFLEAAICGMSDLDSSSFDDCATTAATDVDLTPLTPSSSQVEPAPESPIMTTEEESHTTTPATTTTTTATPAVTEEDVEKEVFANNDGCVEVRGEGSQPEVKRDKVVVNKEAEDEDIKVDDVTFGNRAIDLMSLMYSCNARAELLATDNSGATKHNKKKYAKFVTVSSPSCDPEDSEESPATDDVLPSFAINRQIFHDIVVNKANTFIKSRKYDVAEKILRTAVEVFTRSGIRRGTILEYNYACVLSLQGKVEDSLVMLQIAKTYTAESTDSMVQQLMSDSHLKNVRKHPAYSVQLGLPAPDVRRTSSADLESAHRKYSGGTGDGGDNRLALIAIFPYMTVDEASDALICAEGNLDRAINGILKSS